MKSVYLDYSSKEFYVSQEGYDAIKLLISQHQLCGKCDLPINPEEGRTLVGKNLCLACLLEKQTTLTFVGIEKENDDGDITYGFVDDEGTVYTSRTNYSVKAEKDTYISIQRAGFPLPETYKPFKAEKEVMLNRSDWIVYGKLTDSVIVLGYDERYGQRIHAVFLSYKGGLWVELTKRNSTHKQLFERARLVAESTKRNGYYHINGYEQDQLSDSSLYPLIARMEAAVYDIQRGFMQRQGEEE